MSGWGPRIRSTKKFPGGAGAVDLYLSITNLEKLEYVQQETRSKTVHSHLVYNGKKLKSKCPYKFEWINCGLFYNKMLYSHDNG